MRQLLLESAVLAALGAALGLVLTLWAVAVLRNQMPPAVPALSIVPPRASWRVFVAGLGFAAVTVLIFGLWPAVRASDVDVSEPLKDSTGSATGRSRWRYRPLVIVEVALSLVLLMAAVLLTRAAGRMSASMLGYDRTGLLDARVRMARRYGGDSVERISRDLLVRVRSLPGVRAVAVFGGGGGTAMSEAYDGTNGLLNRASVRGVSDGFLSALGIPVLEGRDLLPDDERGGAVIVDEDAAAGLWPDARAVGRLVKLGGPTSNLPWLRVVGVARRASVGGPQFDPYNREGVFLPRQGAIYVAWRPEPGARGWGLAIRTTRSDPGAAVTLHQAMRDALGPGGQVFWLRPWLWYFDAQMRARSFLVQVFGSFSAFALVLAAIGLYGVVSYRASQRMREFAVRIAVGAPGRDMMALVAHDAAVMILAGTGSGAFVAMWASRLLGDWLYSVHHTDALSLVIAEAVLLAAGFAACLQPALRAMRANPVDILRAI